MIRNFTLNCYFLISAPSIVQANTNYLRKGEMFNFKTWIWLTNADKRKLWFKWTMSSMSGIMLKAKLGI